MNLNPLPDGAALVAGVVGQPIRHSLSPLLHTAWLRDLGINGVYAPFSPKDIHGFERLIASCRSNGIKGLNITAPFKSDALRLADRYEDSVRLCGSANLLTFDEDGTINATTTDGWGLMQAFAHQAPGCNLQSGPVVIMGAGGAARSAAAALIEHGCPEVRIINRTMTRAEEIVFALKSSIRAFDLNELNQAFTDAIAVINAASGGPLPPLDGLSDRSVVMDMTYRPLNTAWLMAAQARGLQTVDGLAMLIEQARPSFEAFYGQAPRGEFDVRAFALSHLGESPK